jgi:hypothetical protein
MAQGKVCGITTGAHRHIATGEKKKKTTKVKFFRCYERFEKVRSRSYASACICVWPYSSCPNIMSKLLPPNSYRKIDCALYSRMLNTVRCVF